ncbi:heme-binding protein [soil metagenome]
MLVPGRTARRALVGVIGAGLTAGAMLLGGAAIAFAEPMPPGPAVPPPGCTAGDLAVASGTVGTAMGNYLFTHPDVNNFFTSLRGLPTEEVHGRVQTYMDANPQVETEITGIRQPLTELRSRCDVVEPVLGS